MKTIIVIGAGASSLAFLNTIHTNTYKVIVLEQNKTAAKKLLATGNGRCNVSNTDLSMIHYNSNKYQDIIQNFNIEDFFDSLGLLLRRQGNLYYPYSLEAVSVKNTLMKHIQNVEFKYNTEVKTIHYNKQYIVETNQGSYTGDFVIVANGSKAGKLSGTHNEMIFKDLHLQQVALEPSLVKVNTNPAFPSLKGLRVKCSLSLYNDTKHIETQSGEVLFTQNGLSGICVMQLSRHLYKCNKPVLHLDLMPEYDKKDMVQLLKRRNQKFHNQYLEGIFDERLANIIHKNNYDVKNIQFKITSTDDYTSAQVMHGGISLEEVNENFESKKYPGLFIIGEALNIDGDCGGYNLHYAFASGNHVAKVLNGRN